MIHRDRKFLDYLRTQRCIFSGLKARPDNAVDPAHIGTAGRGLKSPDFWALPVLHSIHAEMHQRGEMRVIKDIIPDDVLRAALRALAKQMYEEWQSDTEFENRPILAKT